MFDLPEVALIKNHSQSSVLDRLIHVHGYQGRRADRRRAQTSRAGRELMAALKLERRLRRHCFW